MLCRSGGEGGSTSAAAASGGGRARSSRSGGAVGSTSADAESGGGRARSSRITVRHCFASRATTNHDKRRCPQGQQAEDSDGVQQDDDPMAAC